MEKILELSPNHIMAHRMLGLILEDLGMEEKAVSHFKKIISINKTDSNTKGEALYFLSRANYRMQNYKEAKKYLEMAEKYGFYDKNLYNKINDELGDK